MLRVADYIAEYIYRLGVRHVFMVSGGGMMFLSDGIAQHPHLKAVCNHHEQASAMAAAAYAKYNEHLGVAYVTTGCGGTNAITGLLGAWQDSVPCLFISGQSKRKETIRNSGLPLRQFGVQEADIIAIVQSITKYAVMMNEPEMIGYHLDKAVHLAKTGRPGPVWLDIPLDVQATLIEEAKLPQYAPCGHDKAYKEEPTDDEIFLSVKMLKEARRPVIIAGQGIRLSKAISDFSAFIEKNQIPCVASRLGVDLLPSDHPLFIGRIGNKGDRPGNFAVQNADLVLAVGTRLSVSTTGHEYDAFAREAKIIVVDIDPVEHKKSTVKIDLFINADARKFFEKMNGADFPRITEWVEKCRGWKATYPVCLPEQARTRGGVNIYHFVDRLSNKAKPDSVIIGDAGSAVYVPPQALQLKDGQRYITSGAQAEMGYTLPASIGVSFAREKGEVIGITGDGSHKKKNKKLQTVVHHHLPIKLFVWSNDGYLSIRATQKKFFSGRYIGTDKESGVSFPDLTKISKAYGIPYFRMSDSDGLDRTLESALGHPGPVICEVVCVKDQEIIPTVASYQKADGTVVSRPIEDMYPFLDRKEFLQNMIVKPLNADDENTKTRTAIH